MIDWRNIGRQWRGNTGMPTMPPEDKVRTPYGPGIDRLRQNYEDAKRYEAHDRALRDTADEYKAKPAYDNFSTLTDRGGRPSSWN